MKNFFNTINLKGKELEYANAKAMAQEEFVRQVFLANPDRAFSPTQMQKIFAKYDRHIPITSVRRALCNLSHSKYDKFLTKTEEMVQGQYGLKEHKWIMTQQIDETEKWFNEYLEGKHDPPEPIRQGQLF
jgi:hypothetical protein